MSGVLRINGEVVPATHFAYDGCHKFYLIFNDVDMAKMQDYGYGFSLDDSWIYEVADLADEWEGSCSLRFISRADLSGDDIVPQGYEVEPLIQWSESAPK